MSFIVRIFPEGSFERKGHFEDRKGNRIAVTVAKSEVDKATRIALIEGTVKRNGVLSLTSWTNCGSYKTLILRLCPRFPILDGGGAAKMPGISMPWSLTWMGWVCPSSGHAAPDEQGYSAPGNLCCKQRDRASPVLCAERAGAYVPVQPEMLERAEIFPYSADLEPIYLHDKRTANAGHFAGLSGGRLWLEAGA